MNHRYIIGQEGQALSASTLRCCVIICLIWCGVSLATAQTTAFTYQGKLTDAGNPANASYDLQFKLFDTVTVGTGIQQGATVTVPNVLVTAGIFTVQLDFGAGVFPGAPRFLEIAVKPISGGTFTVLGPRQFITSTPYAIKSANAATADGFSVACVNCVTSSQIGSLPANSGNYIQNKDTPPQASASFNISGNGTVAGTLSANLVNATTQFNLGGGRILSAAGSGNLFGGLNAGDANTTGTNNTFVGFKSGQANNTGTNNSFFGLDAGNQNTGGNENSFFGVEAGYSNTGYRNSFFGVAAGSYNSNGSYNSFFGSLSGQLNTSGSNNAFFGYYAGRLNSSASNNAFFGFNAGAANTGDPNDLNLGNENAFFGAAAGEANKAGRNSFFGSKAGQANTTGAGNAFFGYHVGILNNGGNNSFFGVLAGRNNTSGSQNSFFGEQAGDSNQTGNYNSYFGETAGFSNISGSYNTMIGRGANVGSNNLTNATAIGANTRVDQSDALVLGSIAGINGATSSVNVGIGTPTPQARLHVNGTALVTPGNGGEILFHTPNAETGITIKDGGNRADLRFTAGVLKLVVGGNTAPPAATNGIVIDTLGRVGIGTTTPFAFTKLDIVGGLLRLDQLASGDEALCRNSTTRTISACSSSRRYKADVHPFQQGLQLVQRLRPVTFNWKEGSKPDLGLIAEEVAEIAPLLTFKNDQGEIEGVRYAQLNVVLINAVKEQQAQIETQAKQLEIQTKQLAAQQAALKQQQQQLDALKKLVCQANPQATACQE